MIKGFTLPMAVSCSSIILERGVFDDGGGFANSNGFRFIDIRNLGFRALSCLCSVTCPLRFRCLCGLSSPPVPPLTSSPSVHSTAQQRSSPTPDIHRSTSSTSASLEEATKTTQPQNLSRLPPPSRLHHDKAVFFIDHTSSRRWRFHELGSLALPLLPPWISGLPATTAASSGHAPSRPTCPSRSMTAAMLPWRIMCARRKCMMGGKVSLVLGDAWTTL